jgi:hypothetical protein
VLQGTSKQLSLFAKRIPPTTHPQMNYKENKKKKNMMVNDVLCVVYTALE